MELKKNEKVNLDGKSPTFFLLGLVVALGLTLSAFTLSRTPIEDEEDVVIEEIEIDPDEEIIMTDAPIEEPPPPPPPVDVAPPPVEIIKIDEVEDEVEVPDEKLDDTEVDDEDIPDVKIVNTANTNVKTNEVVANLEEDDEEEEILSSRKVASLPLHKKCKKFAGDKKQMKKCLNKELQKEIFSNLASDIEVEEKARVMVTFVVGKDGKITDVKAVSGPKYLHGDAVRAVKRIRPFQEPAKRSDGRPTAMSYKAPILFQPQ